MEDKFKINNINKQLLIMTYSIIVLYSCIYIGKRYTFPQFNTFIYFAIYAIMGFVIPIAINFKSIKKPENKYDKNFFKFSLYFGLGFSMLAESITYYVFEESFLNIIKNSVISMLEFDIWINLLVVSVFAIIIVVYFSGIFRVLLTEFSPLYCIIVCAMAFSVLFSGYTFKNFLLGIAMFGFLLLFEQMKIPAVMLLFSTGISALFEIIYAKYYAFGIMHYYNFVFVVIGFFLIMSSIKVMEKIMLYYRFEPIKWASLAQREMRIIWFGVLLLGIYIATYSGRL